LVKGLKDTDSQIRVIAIKALVNINPEQVSSLISDMFDDSEEEVVITAIWAYGEIKTADNRIFLEKLLSKTGRR